MISRIFAMFAVGLACVAMPSISRGQEAGGDPSLERPPLVAGQVLDAFGGPPEDNVHVYLVWESPIQDDHWRNTGPVETRLLGEAEVDGSGFFQIERPAWYGAMHEAYPRALVTFVGKGIGIETESVVFTGNAPAIIEKKLSEAVLYEDRVLDSKGQPLENAVVTLEEVYAHPNHILSNQRELKHADCLQTEWRPRATTDEKGRFAFKCGVPPASVCLIRITHPDYAPQLRFRPSDGSTPEPPHEVQQSPLFKHWWVNQNDRIRMPAAHRITMRVLDEKGAPMEDALVCPLHSGQQLIAKDDGLIEFMSNSPNAIGTMFAVKASRDRCWQWISATGSSDVPKLIVPAARKITGTVVDSYSGVGVENIVVRCGKELQMQLAVTEADGSFSFTCNNQPTKLALRTSRSGNQDRVIDATGDAHGVEFRIAPLIKFAIQVSLDGSPASNATVSFLQDRSWIGGFSTKSTNMEGEVEFACSAPLHSAILAYGVDGEAGIAIIDGAPPKNPVKIQLQRSISVEGELIQEQIGGALSNPAPSFILGKIEDNGLVEPFGIRQGEWLPLGRSRTDGTFEFFLPLAESWIRMSVLLNGKPRDMNRNASLPLLIDSPMTEYYFRAEANGADRPFLRRK